MDRGAATLSAASPLPRGEGSRRRGRDSLSGFSPAPSSRRPPILAAGPVPPEPAPSICGGHNPPSGKVHSENAKNLNSVIHALTPPREPRLAHPARSGKYPPAKAQKGPFSYHPNWDNRGVCELKKARKRPIADRPNWDEKRGFAQSPTRCTGGDRGVSGRQQSRVIFRNNNRIIQISHRGAREVEVTQPIDNTRETGCWRVGRGCGRRRLRNRL